MVAFSAAVVANWSTGVECTGTSADAAVAGTPLCSALPGSSWFAACRNSAAAPGRRWSFVFPCTASTPATRHDEVEQYLEIRGHKLKTGMFRDNIAETE